MNKEQNNDSMEGIAIIGMACRFPGAKNIDEYWHNLRNGIESVSFFTDEELKAEGVGPELLNDPNYVRANAVLKDIEMFDARFFGLTPREAEITDPQHRVFLECAWNALENAGYDTENYNGRIGVYAGSGMSTYLIRNLIPNLSQTESVSEIQLLMGNNKDFLPTRVSYKLNLKGPSINVSTACSTSLVAVHMACQGLLDFHCDMALAGGVGIQVPQEEGYLYEEGGISSPDGHCRAFDAKAQGTINGNGVGIVVLKRLEDALEDGDNIQAVILGSSVNNDGSAKVGYTAPSVSGQTEVITEALALSGINPETISYIEAHGTGTSLGDPIEIEALTQAFRSSTQNKGFCAIGSVKTNFGHLDEAAGVAGLIKTVLALKHRMIPPSLNYEKQNPEIDFENSPFYVNADLSKWETNGVPLRAGVSSFGIGGTNAHVIVEEAPSQKASGVSRPNHLLTLSARTSTALDTATVNLTEYLRKNPDTNLADIAYTLSNGRRAFDFRRIVVCRTTDEAVDTLSTMNPKQAFTNSCEAKERFVVFMFSGQGTQYVNMGLELYQTEHTFRKQVDICSEILRPILNLDLRDVLYPKEITETSLLDQTAITQPALFVFEYALSKLLGEWGIFPSAMIGHSIGEYVAACLAGVFSLEEALLLVAARGKMIQQLPEGSMLAVFLSEKELQPLLGSGLSLAAVNGPSLCIASGQNELIDNLKDQLAERDVESRKLKTSHAFHSDMVDSILQSFEDQVKKINLKTPKIPYISNVTGTWITGEEATDLHYWSRHLRQTVRFDDGVQELLKDPDRVLLEVGPGRALSTSAIRHPDKKKNHVVLSSVRHQKDNQSDSVFLLTTLGRLWLAGVRVDWSGFYSHEERQRVALPTYPFERERYWIDHPKSENKKSAIRDQLQGESVDGSTQKTYIKKDDIKDWFYVPSWKRTSQTFQISRTETTKYCWLVFINEYGLCKRLVDRLKGEGHDVVAVRVGPEFKQLNDNDYIINPKLPNDYTTMVDGVCKNGHVPNRIIHLWNVENVREDETGLEWSDKAQDLGFYSLLFLSQALGVHNFTDNILMTVISNNMQEVTGGELEYPEKATMLGPVRVIQQEYPNIKCQSIDLDVPESGTLQVDSVIDRILAEFSAQSTDTVVAYRGKHRWAQNYEPIRLDNLGEIMTRLKDGGVYLITGGLGGIGLVLAEYLAKRVKARLVLTGRSTFPPRDEWDEWLDKHDKEDRVSCKIRKLQEMETMGAEILTACVDVANMEQMRETIIQAEKRFGQLNGVIHSAGLPDGAMIFRRTHEMTEEVLAPKVRGTLVLDDILKDVKLDFFVLCSALSSVMGAFGQVGYCGANAFLDAFAQSKTSRDGTFTVAINWDAWREVGMAVESERQLKATKNRPKTKSRKLDHPLFSEHITEGPLLETYISYLNTSKHWILKEHRIMGKSVLPGTAYLEMARAAFEDHAGNGIIEIRDVYFLSPLIVEENEEKEIRTILKKQKDSFEFIIVSRSGEDKWQEHTRGTIASVEDHLQEKYEISEIRAKCNEREITIMGTGDKLQDGLAEFEGIFTAFGPRWRNLKKLNLGTNQGLAVLELPEAYTDDIEFFKLHPALVDIATGFMAIKDGFEGGLPFSYKSLKIKGPLPKKIYSYVRYAGDKQLQNGPLIFDVTILDEHGNVLVEIEEYTLKKVGGDTRTHQLIGDKDKTEKSTSNIQSDNFCLEISKPGILDTLIFRPASRVKPGQGEVEIEVCATGLNFKEVLFAMGLLSLPAGVSAKFGLECAGKIVSIGEGVGDFKIGDEVIAFATSCFSSFTTVSARSVVPKPDNISLEEAATVPAAFMTAYYALITKGGLCKGERVLIHAAAGGVGMAAVNVAQWVGAEIFATAGSPEKRTYLQSLGIKHVMDSRSLDFADEVMKITEGRGVDVVLNSLSGEFIPKGLSVLAIFGRFLELGVRDIYNNSQLGLQPFEKCLSFFAIGVGPDLPNFNSIFREVVQHFNSGNFKPIPHRAFPMTDVAKAFEYMSQAKHIGKIVVTQTDKEALKTLISSQNNKDEGERENGPSLSTLSSQSHPSSLSSIVGIDYDKKTDVHANEFHEDILNGILSSEGTDAFSRILDSGLSQVLVSTIDFQTRLEHNNAFDIMAVEKTDLPGPDHQRPEINADFIAPRNDTEKTLAGIWQNLLGIAEVGIYDNFFELGGDSLLAARVNSRLREAFDIELALSILLEGPTVAELANRIEKVRSSTKELHTRPEVMVSDEEEEGEI